MFERILVPLDGSPRAEVILSLLARILRREDSEIVLLRVVDIPPSVGRVNLAVVRAQHREEAQKYLQGLAERFSSSGAKVHARVAHGAPADVILDTAEREGATMIALSTHGRTGLARWALGSVAEKVARTSDVPVLLVRSFRRGAAGDLEPTVAQEIPFRRILVPVDGSATSMSAVAPAVKFAQLYGSDIFVLHVETPYVPPSPVLPGMEMVLPSSVPPATPSDRDEVTAKAAKFFVQAGLKAARQTTVGEPAAEIIDLSINRGMDLIAMGTHGRTGLARWSLGSVAERVLRSGEAPLLLVRAPATAAKPPRKGKPAKERAHG